MPETAQPGFDIKALLTDLFDGRTLDRTQAREVMGELMDGNLSQMQAAALLASLRTRGETVEEITGFAEAMRERAVKVPAPTGQPLVDTCGTGGTGISTINISTTALFVAAAGGVRIAKHGNRGVTKRSGSADVLEALGVNIDQSPEKIAQGLEQTGVAFVFARSHHPAMKFVAPVRADLKVRTVFNVLGPLTNPAGATRQLLGVFSPDLTETIAHVLQGLGVERALVVHGHGIDDFTVTGPTKVTELNGETIDTFEVTPETFDLINYPREAILGGDPQDNAEATQAILSGELIGAKRDIVILNAGAVLYLAEKTASIQDGVKLAAQLIDEGAALAKLEQYIAFTQQP